MAVVDDLIRALQALNGEGTLDDIFREYSKLTKNPVKSTMRRTLQQFSSDTRSYIKTNPDFFFSVEGLGKGIWGLRLHNSIEERNITSDPADEPVNRRLSLINRVVRDTVLSRRIKELIGGSCQLCETQIRIGNGLFYCETHHIKPLGFPYNGPDKKENILVLCPNCHVMCDFRLFRLDIQQIKNNKQNIGKEFVDFHNKLCEASPYQHLPVQSVSLTSQSFV